MAKRLPNVVSLPNIRLPALREEITELRERLHHLTDLFIANDRSFEIVADIALALQACNSIDQLDRAVGINMTEQSADHARFYIACSDVAEIDAEHIFALETLEHADRQALESFTATSCEACRSATYKALLNVEVQDPASIARIPVTYKNLHGILVIGAEDPDFFANDVGTLYLDFIGATLARTAHRILSELR